MVKRVGDAEAAARIERQTAAGSLRPHDLCVPGHVVDLIVLDPEQKQTAETLDDPAKSGGIIRPWASFADADHGVEKVIARRAAMELRGGMAANADFGISATVPRILLDEGHPQAVTGASEQGAVGGMKLSGFAFGCAPNTDAAWRIRVKAPKAKLALPGAGVDRSPECSGPPRLWPKAVIKETALPGQLALGCVTKDACTCAMAIAASLPGQSTRVNKVTKNRIRAGIGADRSAMIASSVAAAQNPNPSGGPIKALPDLHLV